MLFSVIIPLYNKSDVIERALRSVAAQTFRDYEVIVVDDGSTDGSADIVRHFAASRLWQDTGCTLKLLVQKNAGPSAARNRGAQEALGMFLTMLDGDDCWLPFHLSDLHDIYLQHPDAQVMTTETIEVNEKDSHPSLQQDSAVGVTNVFVHPHGSYPICSDTITVRKELFEQIGGYDVRYSYYEDREFYYRLAERVGDFYVNWRASACYYHDANQGAHKGAIRPYSDYGYLNLVEERLAAGTASDRMVKCAGQSVEALLPRIIVRCDWAAVNSFLKAFPRLSSTRPSLVVLKRCPYARWLVWLRYGWVAFINRL